MTEESVVMDKRELVKASNKTPFQLYLDLLGYVTSPSWIVPYAKKVQEAHGKPFTPGKFMKDSEIWRRNLHERLLESEQPEYRVVIERLIREGNREQLNKIYDGFHNERIITVTGYQRAGLSFWRHSGRFGTIAVDVIMSLLNFECSGLRDDELCMLKKIIEVVIFIVYHLHDVGKFSHYLGSKEDVFYPYCLPRGLSDAEYLTMMKHIHPANVVNQQGAIFRAKNFQRIVNLVATSHHLYMDGSGYIFIPVPKNLSFAEQLFMELAKIIDEVEAGSGIDRPFRKEKSVLKVIRELRVKVKEKKVSERGLSLLSDLAIENSNFTDLKRLKKVPDLEKTMNQYFSEKVINFDRAMEVIDKILLGQPVRTEAARLIEESV